MKICWVSKQTTVIWIFHSIIFFTRVHTMSGIRFFYRAKIWGHPCKYFLSVFANILRDSGAADEVINVNRDKDVQKRLLAEYRVISDALDRLGHGYEAVEDSIRRMHQEFPSIIRCIFLRTSWAKLQCLKISFFFFSFFLLTTLLKFSYFIDLNHISSHNW